MQSSDRKKYLLSKLDELAAELVLDVDKLQAFADRWRGGFRQYSFHNSLLIWFQKPKATLCAGFRQWAKRDRYVLKGQKAIYILCPGFKVEKEADDKGNEKEVKTLQYFFSVPVFDISQTEGQELLIGNTEVSGNGDLTLADVKACSPVPVKVSNGLSDGRTDYKQIVVSQRANKSQMVASFFHELAHINCSHGQKRGEGLSRHVKELEAEAVSFLVCACLGIDNQGSKSYIGHWRGSREKIGKSALKILSVSEKILKKVKPELFQAV